MDSLDPSEQRMLTAVMDLKTQWTAFATAFQPQVFAIVSQAIDTLSSQFPVMQAFMESMLPVIDDLGVRLDASLNGPFWSTFLQNMAEISGPVTDDLVTALGNVVTGIAGIMDAFLPMTTDMTQGLVDLTQRFSDWGTALGDSPGFKKFIDYVNTNWPKAKELIGSVADALVALVQAAAPIGEVIAARLRSFADAVKYLSETNPQLLTFALGLGIFLIAIANLLGPLLSFIRLAQLFATPIGAIALALMAIGAGAAYAYEHSETFRGTVDRLVTALKNFGTAAAPIVEQALFAIKDALMGAVRWIQTNWGPAWNRMSQDVKQAWTDLKGWFSSNSDLFGGLGSTLWNGLKAIVSLVMAFGGLLRSAWDAAFGGLAQIASGIWTGIFNTIKGIIMMIGGIIQTFLGLATGNWSAAWDGMKLIVEGFGTTIGGILRGGLDVVIGLFRTVIGIIIGLWSWLWENGLVPAVNAGMGGVVAVIQGWWSAITGFFGAIGAQIKEAWDQIWNGFDQPVVIATQSVGTTLQGLLTVVMTIAQQIADWIQQKMTEIGTAISTAMTFIQTLWTTGWTLVSTFLQMIWTTMVAWVQAQILVVQTAIQTGLTFIQTLWTTVWTAISTFLQTIWTTMVTWVQTQVTTMLTAITTFLTTVQTTWTTIWTAISAFLTQIWTTMVAAITQFTQQILQTITTWIQSLLTAWQQFWTQFQAAITAGAAAALAAINQMLQAILSAITGFVSQMVAAGAALIQGFVDGILSMAGAVGDAINTVVGAAASFLPGSPAEEGPFSGQGYTKVRGQHLVQDFVAGALGERFDLRRAMRDVADLASLHLTPERAYSAITTPLGGGPSVQVSAGAVVVQVGSGADATAAKAALGNAGDQLADQILDRLRRM